MRRNAHALSTLQLLQEEGIARLTAESLAQRLGVSRATAYRAIADLENVGLLERSAKGVYALGPTVVELDRLIRMNDPLLAASAGVVEELSNRSGATVLLTRLHRLRVVCVQQVRGERGPGDSDLAQSYARGKPMSLFRGATSRIILAHLTRPLLAQVIEEHHDELMAAGLPVSLDALAREMALLRAKGSCVTAGDVVRGTRAWSVVVHHHRKLMGSLSLVVREEQTFDHPNQQIDQLKRAALRIEARLATSS